MNLKENDVHEIRRILGRWGELDSGTEQRSFLDENGVFHLVTICLSWPCVNELVSTGFKCNFSADMKHRDCLLVKIVK